MTSDAPHGGPAARPFVGRAVERTLLRHLLGDAAAGRAAMIVVAGAPGAGKTALLDWTGTAAAAAGADVLRASGYESSLPLAALRRLLAALPELGEVVLRAGDAGADAGVGGVPGEIGRPAPRLVAAIAARARRRPVAVLVDDVQDLGEASCATLTDVLLGLDEEASRSRLRLLVLLTTRLPVEADGLADRVLRLATSRSLTLGGFDERDVFELLVATGMRPGPAVVRQLIEDTGGLPLLLESELDRRRTLTGRRPGPGGSETGAEDLRVRSIADALDRRFDKVDAATVRLLQQAAVLGEPWTGDELALVADLPTGEVAALVDAAEEAHLVTVGRQGMRFAHPLVRAELLDRLGAERRHTLHRLVADRLHRASPGRDDDVMVRVADHLLRSGVDVLTDEQAATVLAAGRIAMAWAAWDQAARFFTAAARASEHGPDVGVSARHHLAAGRAAYFDYDGDLAEDLFARAIALAERAGDDATRLTAAMLLARMRGGRGFRPGDRLDVSELESALRSGLRVPTALLVEANAALAEALIVSGDTDAALAIVDRAHQLGSTAAPAGAGEPENRGGEERSIADALGRLGFAEGIHRLTRLELDAADTCLATGLHHAIAAGNLLTQCLVRSRRAMCGLLRGDIGAAYDELVAVEEQQVAAGFWGEAGLTSAQMAFADVLAGRPAAEDRLEQALREWRRTGFPWNEALLSSSRAAWTARSGRGSGRATELPVTSAVAALSAVEAHDVAGTRAVVENAGWRLGFRGPATMNNAAIAVALVEVGDLLGDRAMVRAGAPALEHVYERGALVVLGWPTTVPRLLAVTARHAGDLALARRYLDHARGLADREDLAPERAKILLERARLFAAPTDESRAEAEAALSEAAQAFDRQSMHGWVARCDDLAHELRLPMVVGASAVRRERTIFTDDVVGSTAANVRLGDPLYLEQLRVHDRIVRGRLRACRGVELKHTGDGINAVFDEPADAVACALAVLADFRDWRAHEPDLALEIRCGLARGPVIPSSGDFYGLVQSEAARLCGLASPGEVLATAAVVGVVEAPEVIEVVEAAGADPAVEAGVARRATARAESLGLHELKGFPKPVEVFRLSSR